MPVNPYDDRKVSLRRPHGNGDLDIVGASYTCRKANVTEASLRRFCFFWSKFGLCPFIKTYNPAYLECFISTIMIFP